jgi:hypothetical protein
MMEALFYVYRRYKAINEHYFHLILLYASSI